VVFPGYLVRPVRALPGGGGYRVETLLEVGSPPNLRLFWAEKQLDTIPIVERYLASLSPQRLGQLRSREPIPVAAAVTDTKTNSPVMVVFGDGVMASNDVTFAAVFKAPYPDLLASSLEWLAGRPENVGINPRSNSFFAFHKASINVGRMVFLPIGLIFLVLLGVGTGVWVVRRR
jgi:hypothetical protein